MTLFSCWALKNQNTSSKEGFQTYILTKCYDKVSCNIYLQFQFLCANGFTVNTKGRVIHNRSTYVLTPQNRLDGAAQLMADLDAGAI